MAPPHHEFEPGSNECKWCGYVRTGTAITAERLRMLAEHAYDATQTADSKPQGIRFLIGFMQRAVTESGGKVTR